MTNVTAKPAALLLTSTHCSHCRALKALLEERDQRGLLQQLDIIDLEKSPDIAQKYGVRSVPWLRLGELVFDSALTPGELDFWINQSTDESGIGHYLGYLLEHGKLAHAIEWLEKGKAGLRDLLPLLSDPDTKFNVRVGIGTIMESFEGTAAIKKIVPDMGKLIESENPALRIDLCHYLSLTHSNDAMEPLTALLADEDTQVADAANEGINYL